MIWLDILLSSGITGIGATMPSGSAIGSILMGLGVELGSGFIRSVGSTVKQKLLTSSHGFLNTDIQKALQRGLIRTYTEMQAENASFSGQDESIAIKLFFDDLIKETNSDSFFQSLLELRDGQIKDFITMPSTGFIEQFSSKIFNDEILASFSESFKFYFK